MIETASGLGTFGSRVSAAGTVSLLFTPNSSIDTVVNVYMNALTVDEDSTKPDKMISSTDQLIVSWDLIKVQILTLRESLNYIIKIFQSLKDLLREIIVM